MGAHTGRCFRALRRKRDQEKKRRLQPVEAAPVRHTTVADSLWNQFAALGQVMQVRDKATKESKQQVRQFRTQGDASRIR